MIRTARLIDLFLNLDKKSGNPPSQLMLFIPLGLWIAARILYSTPFVNYIPDAITYNSVRTFCLAVLGVRELAFSKWDRLAFLGFAVMAGMASMTYLANNLVIFDSLCFVFAGRNADFSKLARFVLVLLVCLVLLVISCAAIGLIPDTVIQRSSSGIARHHLGFKHPNTCPGIAFFVFCTWAYLRNDKYSLVDAIIGVAIATILFVFTNSRVSCGMTAIVAVLALVLQYLPKSFFNIRAVAFLGVGSVAIAAVFSISLSALYDPSIGWMKSLDSMLSNRLALSHAALIEHGVPLLGQKVDSGMLREYDLVTGTWRASGRTVATILDCTYVRLLVSCGLPFLVVGVVLCICVSARAYSRHQWMTVLVIGLIAMHSMIETYAPYLNFNVFLFLIGGLFYRTEPFVRGKHVRIKSNGGNGETSENLH